MSVEIALATVLLYGQSCCSSESYNRHQFRREHVLGVPPPCHDSAVQEWVVLSTGSSFVGCLARKFSCDSVNAAESLHAVVSGGAVSRLSTAAMADGLQAAPVTTLQLVCPVETFRLVCSLMLRAGQVLQCTKRARIAFKCVWKSAVSNFKLV